MSDEPAPPAEVTDPGFKQLNRRIGVNGELTLPDVTPIIHPLHAGRFMRWLNEQWIQFHYFTTGIEAVIVERYLFYVGVGAQNPRTTAAMLALVIVISEERFSTQPILTNLMKYWMHYFDPEAADAIFAERPVMQDPIGKAAAIAVEEATKSYMESAEYRTLKDDIEADVRYQSRRQAYLSAGMKEDVVLLDQEIAQIREERFARKQAKEEAEAPPQEQVEEPRYKQGRGIEEHPEEGGVDTPPIDALPEEPVVGEPAEEEDKVKAERRKRPPGPPPLPREIENLLDRQ